MGKPRLLRETYTPHTTLRPIYTHLHPATLPSITTIVLPTNSSFTYHPVTTELPTPPSQPETENPVTAIALTPQNVITAHRSGHVTMHKHPALTIRPFRDERVVTFVAPDETFSYIALASTDGAIRLYDSAFKQLTHVLDAAKVISYLTFAPGGERLLVGCEDGRVLLFDLLTKRSTPVAEMEVHVQRITGIGFMEDGVVTTSGDGVLTFTPLEGLLFKEKRLLHVGEPLVGLVVMRRFCVTVGERCVLRVWDVRKGVEIVENELRLPYVTMDVTDDDDGRDIVTVVDIRENGRGRIVVSLSDQTLLFVNVSEEGVLSLDEEVICGNLEEVYDIARVSTDGESYDFALATNSSTLWVMTFEAPNLEPIPPDAEPKNHGMWKCQTGLTGHDGIILSLDAKNGLLASGARDRAARIWQQKGGKWACTGIAEGHAEAVSAVALSPKTEKFLVTGAADKMIKLWPITGRKRMSAKWTVLAHEKDVNAVAISPDGKLIASGSQDRTLKIWNITGKLVAKCSGHKRGIWSLSFSPVDRIIASASGDSTVRLWSLDGTCLRTFQGHLSGVLRTIFINSGMQVVTSGADGLLKIWLTRSGECGGTVDAHSDRVWALDAIDDGGVVVSAGADGKVRIWTDATEIVKDRKRKRREEMVTIGQAVDDATRQRNWAVAMRGSLELGMTGRLRDVLSEMVTVMPEPVPEMRNTIQEMVKVKEVNEKSLWGLVRKLLLCCREWVSTGGSRNAVLASVVMNGVLGIWRVEEIVDGIGADGELVGVLVKQFERHYRRVGEMEVRCALMEHTVAMMRGLGELDGVGEGNAGEAVVKEKEKAEKSDKRVQQVENEQADNIDAEQEKDEKTLETRDEQKAEKVDKTDQTKRETGEKEVSRKRKRRENSPEPTKKGIKQNTVVAIDVH